MEIFNSFADNKSTIRVESIWNCLVGLGLSAFFNLILGEIYKVMNKTKQNNYIMMQSMVFISVILAGAMMVIGNNLAVAFGLGAVGVGIQHSAAAVRQGRLHPCAELLVLAYDVEKLLHQLVALVLEQLMPLARCLVARLNALHFHTRGVDSQFSHAFLSPLFP